MSVAGEISGVTLNYVAREVQGNIPCTLTKFDKDLGENVHEMTKVKEPVIVFFPNGTTQVMSRKRAEGLGFLEQPDILNFASVQDSKTPAGRYKNAIRESDRLNAWLTMENAVIQRCVSKSGHPLPLDCTYSDYSLYMGVEPPTEKTKTQKEKAA